MGEERETTVDNYSPVTKTIFLELHVAGQAYFCLIDKYLHIYIVSPAFFYSSNNLYFPTVAY